MLLSISHIAKAAALASTLLVASAAMAQNIAIVNGKPVPVARMETLIGQVVKQGQPRTPELEAKVREQLVLREIFAQEAERRGLAATADFRQQVEFAKQAALIQALFADQEKKIGANEAAARAEYDKLKAQNGDKEFRARHILVESEDQAKALIAQLKGGASFEDLAKKNSKDPGSAENGGDLDWAAPGNFVKEFSDAMVALKKGDFTQAPVKSQFGFHIIKLDDTRAVQFPEFDQVKAQIIQRTTQEKMKLFIDELKAKAKTDYKFAP